MTKSEVMDFDILLSSPSGLREGHRPVCFGSCAATAFHLSSPLSHPIMQRGKQHAGRNVCEKKKIEGKRRNICISDWRSLELAVLFHNQLTFSIFFLLLVMTMNLTTIILSSLQSQLFD